MKAFKISHDLVEFIQFQKDNKSTTYHTIKVNENIEKN